MATTTGANRTAVLLRVPPSLADEPELRITISAPTGAVSYSSSGTPRDLDETVVLVPIEEPGNYRVRYFGASERSTPIDHWFRVESP